MAGNSGDEREKKKGPLKKERGTTGKPHREGNPDTGI